MNNLPIWPLCRGKIATRWLNIDPPRGSTGFFFCFVLFSEVVMSSGASQHTGTKHRLLAPVEFKGAAGSSRTAQTRREKAGEGLKAVCFTGTPFALFSWD